jgi:hypothetical protein
MLNTERRAAALTIFLWRATALGASQIARFQQKGRQHVPAQAPRERRNYSEPSTLDGTWFIRADF